MISKTKPKYYWDNYDRCKEAALLCNTKTEFEDNYGGAYKAAHRNGWYKELCSYIKKLF